MTSRLSPLILLFSVLLPWPALADGADEGAALTWSLQQAHDGDLSALLRLMSAAESTRFHNQDGAARLRVLREDLGPWLQVICTPASQEGWPPLPSSAGFLLPPREFRCQARCQHGTYAVLATFSAADPLVVPRPRPGLLEGLVLASPLLDTRPYALTLPPGPCLAALFGLGLFLLLRGATRLQGWPRPLHPDPDDAAVPGTGRWRHAYQEGVLVLRLLGALSVGLCAVRWWRDQPLPLWGYTAVRLVYLGLLLNMVGLVLCALGRHLDPRPHPVGDFCGTALLLALCVGLSADALFAAPERAAAPGHVRRGGGPLLDWVSLYPDGRSCHGRAPERCRSFGQPVRAPAPCTVLHIQDRHPDQPVGQRDREHPAGNYLVLRCAGEFVVLSHLMRGSANVRPGQAVAAGQVVAALGNSGDSDEPHGELQRWPALHPLP